mgnify:CR=1 FL=1
MILGGLAYTGKVILPYSISYITKLIIGILVSLWGDMLMKWTKSIPKIGDMRTRKVFLWLPECVIKNNQRTWYWLQSMKVTERYANVEYYDDYAFDGVVVRKEWTIVSLEEL